MTRLQERLDQKLSPGVYGMNDDSYLPFCALNRFEDVDRFVRPDFDGVPFLDIFSPEVSRQAFEVPMTTECTNWDTIPDGATKLRNVSHAEYMRRIRNQLEEWISHPGEPRIRAKHLWLANYFNSAIEGTDIAPLPVEWNPADE
jgi:hypothetical protein